jgi:hypothetical protein
MRQIDPSPTGEWITSYTHTRSSKCDKCGAIFDHIFERSDGLWLCVKDFYEHEVIDDRKDTS